MAVVVVVTLLQTFVNPWRTDSSKDFIIDILMSQTGQVNCETSLRRT